MHKRLFELRPPSNCVEKIKFDGIEEKRHGNKRTIRCWLSFARRLGWSDRPASSRWKCLNIMMRRCEGTVDGKRFSITCKKDPNSHITSISINFIFNLSMDGEESYFPKFIASASLIFQHLSIFQQTFYFSCLRLEKPTGRTVNFTRIITRWSACGNSQSKKRFS